jgi:hypothetical protein
MDEVTSAAASGGATVQHDEMNGIGTRCFDANMLDLSWKFATLRTTK